LNLSYLQIFFENLKLIR